jgi:hypothetical protein
MLAFKVIRYTVLLLILIKAWFMQPITVSSSRLVDGSLCAGTCKWVDMPGCRPAFCQWQYAAGYNTVWKFDQQSSSV